MNPSATVLVPTFDHGPMLHRSVGSALRQTVTDIEVFIVGDGVSDETRAIIADLERDPRVRFFDNRDKGENFGERYRHLALGESRGDIVCYLADDDLWMPHHIETMRTLLADADFAHTLPFRVEPRGGFFVFELDLSLRTHRWLLTGPANRIPLSMGGHTLAHYRRLSHGWRVTPRGTSIPLYMWQQLMEVPGCRVRTGNTPTVLHFPSLHRLEMSLADRVEELDAWVSRLEEPAFRVSLAEALLNDRQQRASRFAVPKDLLYGVFLRAVPFPSVRTRLRRALVRETR